MGPYESQQIFKKILSKKYKIKGFHQNVHFINGNKTDLRSNKKMQGLVFSRKI